LNKDYVLLEGVCMWRPPLWWTWSLWN